MKNHFEIPPLTTNARSPKWRWLYLAICCFASGCTALSTVVVSTDLDVQVKGRDASGVEWRTAPTEIIRVPRNSATAVGASSFSQIHYEGKLFDWQFGANAEGFGYAIRSKVAGKLCFRFDQAHLVSSMQSKKILMCVYFARQGPGQKPTLLMRRKGGEHRNFEAPPLCFTQENLAPFTFALDLAELFPSGNMFNIR